MAGSLLLFHQLEHGSEEPSEGLGHPFFLGWVETPHPVVEKNLFLQELWVGMAQTVYDCPMDIMQTSLQRRL